MTGAEIVAFNAGVRAALDAARQTAQALRDKPGWKPTREGAADALDELAITGSALLIDDPDAPLGALVGPSGPRPYAAAHEFVIAANRRRRLQSEI
ncbi:MAG: hypothetical protein WBD95_01995 [Xanthobacteraceae bacterium]